MYCSKCGGIDKKKSGQLHTCLGGQCGACKKHRKRLDLHACGVEKADYTFEHVLKQGDPIRCGVCEIPFFGTKLVPWKGIPSCEDCRQKQEIQIEIENLFRLVREKLVVEGRTACAMCQSAIFKDGVQVKKFHHDHVNPFLKTDRAQCISTMVFEGWPIEDIFVEMRNCRVLCVSCHSFVTHVQTCLGVPLCKKAEFAECKQLEMCKKSQFFADSMFEIHPRKRAKSTH
jgi:hypothetical protein